MDDLVVLRTVATEPEANVIAGFLGDEGIQTLVRPTNFAVGASDGFPAAGPREIVVRADDAARARELLDRRLPV